MEETKEESKSNEPEVGQMRKGDYMIHVYIEQAKQLKCEGAATIDPMIEVTVMGEKKYTTAKDNITQQSFINWSEHLFFEPRSVKVEDIEQAKISIKLQDKGYFKDAIIGQYEFDVAFIYFKAKHCLLHQWLALSNPASQNFNEITAYLKISISVACSGDEQVQITDDPNSDDSDNVLMPLSVKPEYYQIRFKFFKAEKLPIMDEGVLGVGAGTIDAYIHCKFMNQKLKTKTVTMKGDTLDWNQEFLVPCKLPIMSSRIVMTLWDQDAIKDELVGSLMFDLKTIMSYAKDADPADEKLYFWKNIYGAPLKCSGANTDLMNGNPEASSTWKGRILMQVTAEKTEKPLLKLEDLKIEDIDASFKYKQAREYEIIADIGQGIALPDKKQYRVKIKVADFEILTDTPMQAENTYNRWNFRFKQKTWTTSYQNVEDMGKMYIYLMDGDKAVCYWKDDIKNYMDPDPKLKWIELINDLAIGKVKDAHKAGLISFRLCVHDVQKSGKIDYSKFESWRKPPPRRLDVFKVRCYIFQCRNLPAADSDGQSDPYVQIWDTSEKLQCTPYIEDNVNPFFFECIDINVEAQSLETMPPFVLDVYDKDFGIADPDDFICRAIIPVDEEVCSFNKEDKVPTPRWHGGRFSPTSPIEGEILISFTVVDSDYSFARKNPKDAGLIESVIFDDFTIEVNILGLRSLQSVGILPVKKAFIQFNLKSLVPPQNGQALENLRTQPGPAGANPTINTLIKFLLPLPCDKLYCPRLQCSVFDNIYKSFMQPLIGCFTIPVGDLLHGRQKQREEEVKTLKTIISELDKILRGEFPAQYTIQDNPFRPTLTTDSFYVKASINAETKQITRKYTEEDSNPGSMREMNKPLLDLSDVDHQQENYGKWEDRKTPRRTPASIARDSQNNTLSKARDVADNTKQRGATLGLKQAQIDKFNPEIKAKLMEERKEAEAKIKREQQDLRERDLQLFKGEGGDISAKFIIFPQYMKDERLGVDRECNLPPESLYIGLGWNPNSADEIKHYRRFYPDELENITELMPVKSPFDEYIVKKGQSRGASAGLWPFGNKKEDASGSTSTEQVMGKFKGIVTVQSDKHKVEHEKERDELIHELKNILNRISLKVEKAPFDFKLDRLETVEGKNKFNLDLEKLGVGHLGITKHLQNMGQEENLKKMLMSQTKCLVRVYILSAFDLASRDNDSPSDPYIVVSLGKKVYNERDNYQLDQPNPDFYKCYEFEGTFPGCPPLSIQAYDWDQLFGDDLIGETLVDLEDRYFSPDWQAIKNKPIEYRQIYHESSSISQGVIKMWVEIFNSTSGTADDSEQKVWQIAPKPPEEFEVRICVFDTEDVINMDVEGTSDVYIRGFFDTNEEVKETDTHYRCQNGTASFNYRLIYNVKYPRKDYKYTLQVYDRDFFKSNDIIGEVQINLKCPFEDASLANKQISVNKSYWNSYLKSKNIVGKQLIGEDKYKTPDIDFRDDDSFFIETFGKDEKTNYQVMNGKVRIRVDILPKARAEASKAGEGRDEPNQEPYLPPPVGRIKFSMNPFEMINQLLGASARRKLYCCCCVVLCCTLFIAMAPMIFSNLVSKIIMPF